MYFASPAIIYWFDLLSSAERSCSPKRSERRTKRATPWRIISHWGVSLRRCRKWLFVFRATDWLWSAEPREMLFTTDCTIRSPSLPLLRPQSHTLTLQLTALLKTKMIPPLSFLWHHHCWSLDVYLRALTLTHLPSQLRRRSWCCRAVEKQTERKDLQSTPGPIKCMKRITTTTTKKTSQFITTWI